MQRLPPQALSARNCLSAFWEAKHSKAGFESWFHFDLIPFLLVVVDAFETGGEGNQEGDEIRLGSLAELRDFRAADVLAERVSGCSHGFSQGIGRKFVIHGERVSECCEKLHPVILWEDFGQCVKTDGDKLLKARWLCSRPCHKNS